MFKKAAQNLAVALLFAASVIPVIHGFHSKPAPRGHVVVAVSGGDPEPIEPGVARTILAFLGLA
jgi:hypothetical protein